VQNPVQNPECLTGYFATPATYTRGYFREYSIGARRLRAPLNPKLGSQLHPADLQVGHPMTPRDCSVQRTSPNGESYKEFTKCLTLILTVAKLYPVKKLQSELLTFVEVQLPFSSFPPNRSRHKKQNHLIKRAKTFQRWKMGGSVEAIPSRIRNRKGTHTTPEGKIYRSESASS
jgi:hypothetical protein